MVISTNHYHLTRVSKMIKVNININTICRHQNNSGISITNTVISTVQKLDTPTFSAAEVILALKMQGLEIWGKVDGNTRTGKKEVLGANQIKRAISAQYSKLSNGSIWYVNPDNKAGKAIFKAQDEAEDFRAEHGESA